MALQSNRLCEPNYQDGTPSCTLAAGLHDFNLQCLRILRCTAMAMINSPGGLRFKAGMRPWLEGLSVAQPVLKTRSQRQLEATLFTASD